MMTFRYIGRIRYSSIAHKGRSRPARKPSQPRYLFESMEVSHMNRSLEMGYLPRDMTFPSAHHSPSTVNKKAKLFVMGTVKLSSVCIVSY